MCKEERGLYWSSMLTCRHCIFSSQKEERLLEESFASASSDHPSLSGVSLRGTIFDGFSRMKAKIELCNSHCVWVRG